jgi:hypothetical protein
MVGELGAVVTELRAEVAQSRRQLGQNSRNSSKPPLSDSLFVKSAPKSLRRKSGASRVGSATTCGDASGV